MDRGVGGGGGGQEEALIAAALEKEETRRLVAERGGRPYSAGGGGGGEQGGLLLLLPPREEEVLGCALLPRREVAPGECDITARVWGSRAGRLPGSAPAALANVLPPPAPAPAPHLGPVISMSAKERPKSKAATKESVTLLPCFYFVEVRGCLRGSAGVGGGREPGVSARGWLAGGGMPLPSRKPRLKEQQPSVGAHQARLRVCLHVRLHEMRLKRNRGVG